MRFGTQTDEETSAGINSMLKQDEELAAKAGLVGDAANALERMKDGPTLSETRSKRTDFDADLTDEEKARALQMAKEAEAKRIEKEAKSAQKALQSEVAWRTKGFKIIAYILYALTAVFDVVLYLVVPSWMIVPVSSLFKCSKLGNKEPFPRELAEKLIMHNQKKKEKRERAKLTKEKKDDFIGMLNFFIGFMVRSMVLCGVGFCAICIFLLGPIGILICMLILLCAINAIVGIDCKLMKSSREFAGKAEQYTREQMQAIETATRTAMIEAEEKDLEGMTEKEKMAYLKSTGKVEMKEVNEHQQQYNNYYN